MSIEKITFETDHNDAFFQGRNGTGKCRGVELRTNPQDLLIIMPIHSKGDLANCVITVPMTKIDDVITALTKLRDEAKKPKKKRK